MTIQTIALLAAIIAFLADAVSTRYAMRKGLVEVGPLTSRLFGRHLSFWEAVVWHGAKIGLAVLVYVYAPAEYVPWALFGFALPTMFYAIQNVRRARD